MRSNRRQNVFHRAVFVEVAADAKRRQVAHLLGTGHRTTKHQDRQAALIQFADAPHQFDPRRVRHAQIHYDEIQFVEVGVHLRQQLGDALGHDGAMA